MKHPDSSYCDGNSIQQATCNGNLPDKEQIYCNKGYSCTYDDKSNPVCKKKMYDQPICKGPQKEQLDQYTKSGITFINEFGELELFEDDLPTEDFCAEVYYSDEPDAKNLLFEFYCVGEHDAKVNDVYCEKGCKDGACIK